MNPRRLLLLTCLAAPWLGGWHGDKATSLTIYPQRIHLGSAVERERVIVVAHYPGGITRDVTQEVELSFARKGIATVAGDGIVAPTADGNTELVAHLGRFRDSFMIGFHRSVEVTAIQRFRLK